MTKIIAAATQKPALAIAGGALALVAAGLITALKLRSNQPGILPMEEA